MYCFVFNNLFLPVLKRPREFPNQSVSNKKVQFNLNPDTRYYSRQVSQNDPIQTYRSDPRQASNIDPRQAYQNDQRLAYINDPPQVSRKDPRLAYTNDPRQAYQQNDPRQAYQQNDPGLNNYDQGPRSRDLRTRESSTQPMSSYSSGQVNGSGVPFTPQMHQQIVNSQYQNTGQFPYGTRQQPRFAEPPNNTKVYKSQKTSARMNAMDGSSANRDYNSHIY